MPEFCRAERDGRLLVVTIDRPEVMNAVHPPANLELASIFDETDLVLVESREASDTHTLALPLAYIYAHNVLVFYRADPDKMLLREFLADEELMNAFRKAPAAAVNTAAARTTPRAKRAQASTQRTRVRRQAAAAASITGRESFTIGRL